MNPKPIALLTVQDLLDHPAWGWIEDDSDLLLPVTTVSDICEDYDSIVVEAQVRLADATVWPGYVLVRTSDLAVYGVGVWESASSKWAHLALQPMVRTMQRQQAFVNELSRPTEAVFPIGYSIGQIGGMSEIESGSVAALEG